MSKSINPKNTGISYENLTQRIFSEILNQNSVNTIKVEQNVKLKGITTNHQIDVYWEFDVGNINYKTIVQAKDWGKPVDQGELLKFKAVIEDLPSQPKGIFVTKTGYQKGALEYAISQGIALYELRKPIDSDWKGKTREIIIELSMFIPHTSNININVDTEWMKNEIKNNQIPKTDLKDVKISGYTDQMYLYNSRKKKKGTVKQILDSLTPSGFKEFKQTNKIHTFANPTFIDTNIPSLPKAKIQSISATVAVYKTIEKVEIKGDDIVSFILKNILKGTELTFDKNLKPRNELIT